MGKRPATLTYVSVAKLSTSSAALGTTLPHSYDVLNMFYFLI